MTNRNWVVGVFVVAGLLLFTLGLYMVGDRHQAFAKHVLGGHPKPAIDNHFKTGHRETA
jgi:hypothetical protein